MLSDKNKKNCLRVLTDKNNYVNIIHASNKTTKISLWKESNNMNPICWQEYKKKKALRDAKEQYIKESILVFLGTILAMIEI